VLKRTLENKILEILLDYQKMVFVSGPRQSGKTTLAHLIQKNFQQSYYFNWDNLDDQKKITRDPYFFSDFDRNFKLPILIIFDEIHKYPKWKNYLKGVYDKYHQEFSFIVTGSCRLDIFQKGGDSLFGRYFPIPCFPLTLGELAGKFTTFQTFKDNCADPPESSSEIEANYQHLFDFSGFPEPLLRAEKNFYNIWELERKKLLVREDIRDTTNIRQLALLELLTQILPNKIGSLLSINSLREDLGVSFETVRDWLEILKQFYYLFAVHPYQTSNMKRLLKKEAKIYLYNWVEIEDEAIRFENLVALHLFKAVKIWQAIGEGNIELNYIRNKEQKEVDFIISENNKPLFLIECKSQIENFDKNLLYFQQKLNIPTAVQLINKSGVCRKQKTEVGSAYLISADRWLSLLL